jgi:hypothetical protein
MPSFQNRRTVRLRAKRLLDDLMNERNSVFIVHYTCENLFKEDGSSPRITGIVVRNLGSGETKAFSVHLEAERRELGTDPALAADAFDAVEKQLLTDFFELARANKNAKWIHWKMRDPTYGFPAIEHRFRVLKGKPFEIPPSQLIDLSVVVQDIYGPTYTMAHPRLVELVRLNKITDRDLVPGKEEPQLFKEGKFRALHNSALRKVSVIETIAKKTWSGRSGPH